MLIFELAFNRIDMERKGFISVVALGIFALLSIFSIIVQITIMSTAQTIKSTNNYYAARDLSDSMI